MKSFCPHCGSLMMYAGAKPKFCSSCGNELGSFSVSYKKKGQPTREEDEDGNPNVPTPEETNFIPNINSLQVDIQASSPQKHTLGQVLETYSNVKPNESSQDDFSHPQNNVSSEQFLDNFKKEAGTLRQK